MSDASTVYDIRLRWLLEDQASRPTEALHQSIERTTHSASGLMATLGHVGGIVAGAFGVHKAKEAFIDFNSEIEQSKITIAGMLQMNMGGEWTDNIQKAADLFGKLQQEAKTSVGTTKDFIEMAQNMVQPITAAGGSMEDLQAITKGMVVAAKSMGFSPEVAALEAKEVLNGVYTSRNRFASGLLGPMGFKGEEGRHKWNTEMNEQQRLEAFQKAITSPAIKRMAETQEKSFAGAMSTLEDNIQMTLGKVGVPLFKSVTDELNTWNAWLDANQAKVAEIGKTVSHVLVEGFKTVKSVTAAIGDNWKLILGLFAASKGAGMIGGLVGEITSLKGALTGLSGAAAGGVGLGGFVGALGNAASALGLLAVAASAFAGWVDKRQGEQLKAREPLSGTIPATLQALHGGNVKMALAQLRSMGMLGEGNALNEGQLSTMFAAGSRREQLDFAKQLGVGSEFIPLFGDAGGKALASAFVKYAAPFFQQGTYDMRKDLNPTWNMLEGVRKVDLAKGKTNVNININRIEVASDDPDRFVFQLQETVKDALKRGIPTRALREG